MWTPTVVSLSSRCACAVVRHVDLDQLDHRRRGEHLVRQMGRRHVRRDQWHADPLMPMASESFIHQHLLRTWVQAHAVPECADRVLGDRADDEDGFVQTRLGEHPRPDGRSDPATRSTAARRRCAVGRSDRPPRLTNTVAERVTSPGSRPASIGKPARRRWSRRRSPPGVFPYQSNQMFHASTWGNAARNTRSPVEPTISGTGTAGRGQQHSVVESFERSVEGHTLTCEQAPDDVERLNEPRSAAIERHTEKARNSVSFQPNRARAPAVRR